jgi:diguanylate cyclase (GGDEF)-like protein
MRRVRVTRRSAWTIVAYVVLAVGLVGAAAVAKAWHDSELRQERQAFQSTAAGVTATLATSLRRDTDFVRTVSSVLTMEPHLTPTEFNTWYATLDGQARQVGSLGTAVVDRVHPAELAKFLARRNPDAAFQSLVTEVLPVPRHLHGDYCLLAAGGAIVNLDPSTSRMVQGDWCDPTSGVGDSQFAATLSSTETGQFLGFSATAVGVPTMLIEGAFYRRGADLYSPFQRRMASAGWIVSTFDVTGLITQAINGARGLEVTLLHRNPGEPWKVMGAAGAVGQGHQLARTSDLQLDGQWQVRVRGVQPLRGMSANVQAGLLFAGASLVSILLFILVLVLSRSRDQALGMVEEKTGQLRHQALHDALTELPNRVLALDRADQMLARARRAHIPMAALYVDIDGFKHINDTFGHAAGDAFLRVTADRMRSVIREADTAARLSGDEFIVLLDGSGLDSGPELVAERLLTVIREPCDLGPDVGRSLSVTASIGIAYGLQGTAEQLMADADVALYVAKSLGKNRCILFESGMQTAAQDRLKLEMDLAEALAGGELFLVYQPTIDLESERTIGVEALLRWRHPERGVLAPDTFIPIAEDSGLIVPIGRWVLEEACEQAARWRRTGHEIGISVNVSARQLDDDGLREHVEQALQSSGLDPGVLTLEITETTLVHNAQDTVQRLGELKALGIRIAIDDFGTGYSSLAYLRQFPVDSLKIDRSFVSGIADSRQSQAVIQTLVRLGKTLRLETLAEGIEDREQLAALKRQHCDHGQGFLFAHPLEAEQLEQFLDGHGSEALAS